MTTQEEVLAHLGNALLAAQVVERFVALTLSAQALQPGASALDALLAKPKKSLTAKLKGLLSHLRESGWDVPQLESELRDFQGRRNQLVHAFHQMGPWNFRRTKDCDSCVIVLRDFVDRAHRLTSLFVTALSIRDAHFKTKVPDSDSKSYAADVRRLYGPLNNRTSDRIVA